MNMQLTEKQLKYLQEYTRFKQFFACAARTSEEPWKLLNEFKLLW